MISAIGWVVPIGFWIFLGFVVIVAAVLVFYALYSKGEVLAVFSHGSTTFKLEAKGRPSKRGTVRRASS
jgi:hypothetical protein